MAETSPPPAESSFEAQWAYALTGDGIKYALSQAVDWPVHQEYVAAEGLGVLTALTSSFQAPVTTSGEEPGSERLLLVARRQYDGSTWTAGVATGGMLHPILSYNLQPTAAELQAIPASAQASCEHTIWQLTRARHGYQSVLSEQLLRAVTQQELVRRRWLRALGLTAVQWF